MRRSAAPSFQSGGPGKRIKFSSPFLTNNKKCSPTPLPLRELKDVAEIINTSAAICSDDKENRDACSSSTTKFNVPKLNVQKVVQKTDLRSGHVSDKGLPVCGSKPSSVKPQFNAHRNKTFSQPKIVLLTSENVLNTSKTIKSDEQVSCRYYKAMFAK